MSGKPDLCDMFESRKEMLSSFSFKETFFNIGDPWTWQMTTHSVRELVWRQYQIFTKERQNGRDLIKEGLKLIFDPVIFAKKSIKLVWRQYQIFYNGNIKWEGSDKKGLKLMEMDCRGRIDRRGDTMILEIVDRDNMGMVFGLMDVTSLLCWNNPHKILPFTTCCIKP